MRGRTWPAPHILFLLLATIGGLVLVALIPPLGGGNEQMNFRRAASIASGRAAVGPAALPGGIADVLAMSDATFREGRNPPYSYSRAEWERLAAIDLGAERPKTVAANPIAVLHPVAYLPQSPVIALGEALGLSPLILFYLGRLAGLAAGIGLTALAIRIVPVHRHGLAAIALLPTILFTRSTLDADQLSNGLAFLFAALAMREIAAGGRIRAGPVAALAIAAFLLAQAKSAYLLLPLLALAIPAERFESARARAGALALIVLPGAIGSIAWMVILRQGYFDAIAYRTWSGLVVPDRQLAGILADPAGFAGVVARTLFATPLIPRSLIDFLGVFGPPVKMPMPFYPLLAVLAAAALIAGEGASRGRLQARSTRLLAIGLALATTTIILTLLYLQWTRLGGPVIDGFSGRYLYPLAPLLLLFVPARGKPVLGVPAGGWLALAGAVSIGGTWWVTWATYWA